MTAAPSEGLTQRIAERLSQEVDPAVAHFAKLLGEEAGALAVLFYGSNLRTGSREGVLDFYVLLPGVQKERIWPRIGYREWTYEGEVLRAKIATMSLEKFAEAARGDTRDTTIWTRFVQPSALVWQASEDAADRTIAAIADAARTAATLAAALGPECGRAEDYWRALFRATYSAEFRVEKSGREESILAVNREHFDGLLPLAWEAAGIAWRDAGGLLCPHLQPERRRERLRWWARRRRLGKPLNLLRLSKASTTFDGAADYAAWKIERHTGIALEVTPWRRKYPLLAAPQVLWTLWRGKRHASPRS
ncbi:hypothetical protein GRI38_08415 [Altererythrobacter aurantiacus]|uniref:Uncharacterized protein n=1 Tax=Parapontixanthobacter aurantiacus TaxID=1463599 RepID=A0A844ZK26_9SPHN|nr:hypothetical protein [Parapontixanthobacter aurantiacus]MXO86049.1 hypothetical protein [Parapontixanthobacter aurantiacus]